MRFDIMTLFPELVNYVLNQSIIGRARQAGILDIRTYNIRDYSDDRRHRVDDTPYGGGRGMLMAPPPIWNCYRAVLADGLPADAAPEKPPRTKVLYLSPRGRVFTQKTAQTLAEENDRLILLCGHYEGIDERIIELEIDEELSVGNYVLTGGELPAAIVVDCVSRMVPGVLPAPECYTDESLQNGLLEHAQYTRPRVFEGLAVPEVLINGNHALQQKWKLEQSLIRTAEKRPDLMERSDDKKEKEIQKSK